MRASMDRVSAIRASVMRSSIHGFGTGDATSRRALFATASLVATLGLAPGTAHGLTLRESVQAALEQDPRVQAAALDTVASGAIADAVRTERLPRATFAADYGREDIETDALFPESGARSPYTLSGTVTQPLYRGGLTTARIAQADAERAATEDDRRDLSSRIVLAAVTAYLDVVRGESVVELNRSNLSALEQAHDDAGKRFDAGEATRTDVAQALARQAEAQAQLRRAEAQLASSRASFLRLTGRPASDLVPTWREPALPASLEAAVALAVGAPSVEALKSSAASARASVDVAKAARRPRIDLEGSGARQDNTEFGFDPLDEWKVQVKLSVPIYEAGETRSRVSAAGAKADAADLRVEDARRAATERTTQDWAALQASADVIKAYEAQVEASRLALDGTRKELAVGTRTTLDLLDAEREFVSAQVNLVGARRDRAVAAYGLLDSCGTLGVEAIPASE